MDRIIISFKPKPSADLSFFFFLIIEDGICELRKKAPKSGLHVLWECGVAQDVWAGSSIRLQKCIQGLEDVIQLFEDLLS